MYGRKIQNKNNGEKNTNNAMGKLVNTRIVGVLSKYQLIPTLHDT